MLYWFEIELFVTYNDLKENLLIPFKSTDKIYTKEEYKNNQQKIKDFFNLKSKDVESKVNFDIINLDESNNTLLLKGMFTSTGTEIDWEDFNKLVFNKINHPFLKTYCLSVFYFDDNKIFTYQKR